MIARILVVDDDSEFRKSLRRYLESRRHRVIEAADGAQAFAMAENEMPHLILMDIVMPGLYGSAASKKLQEYWRTSKIPIIVLSAFSDAPVKALIQENPKIRFLKKPLEMPRLDELIGELLPLGGFIP